MHNYLFVFLLAIGLVGNYGFAGITIVPNDSSTPYARVMPEYASKFADRPQMIKQIIDENGYFDNQSHLSIYGGRIVYGSQYGGHAGPLGDLLFNGQAFDLKPGEVLPGDQYVIVHVKDGTTQTIQISVKLDTNEGTLEFNQNVPVTVNGGLSADRIPFSVVLQGDKTLLVNQVGVTP